MVWHLPRATRASHGQKAGFTNPAALPCGSACLTAGPHPEGDEESVQRGSNALST